MSSASSRAAALAVGVSALIAGPAVRTADARLVPGVVSQTPLEERDFTRMGRGGVEKLRVLFRWRERAFQLGADPRYRISDLIWFAWRDSTVVEPFCTFCRRAGLFDLDGLPKRSWAAFRRAARGASK